MALGGDTGTASGIDFDLRIGELRFDDERIGNHADIGAQTDHFHFFQLFLFPVRPTKIGLVNDLASFHVKSVRNLPAPGSFDAMFHRKLSSFCGLQILVQAGRYEDRRQGYRQIQGF